MVGAATMLTSPTRPKLPITAGPSRHGGAARCSATALHSAMKQPNRQAWVRHDRRSRGWRHHSAHSEACSCPYDSRPLGGEAGNRVRNSTATATIATADRP